MIPRARARLAGAVVAVVTGVAAHAASPVRAAEATACRRPLAEWPVRLDHGVPVTAGTVNGAAAGVMIDTGAAASVVTREAARRLRLAARSSPERMRGIGGDSVVRVARVDDLTIGNWPAHATTLRLSGDLGIPGVDVVLGEDVLHAVDLEFDYGHRVVRVYEPASCGDARLAGWDASAQVLPIERDERAVRMAIEVNAIPALAILDSGAVRTMATLDFAYRAGLAPDAPGVQAAGCAEGLGGEVVRAWQGRFDSVRLAHETLRDVQLAFADFAVAPDAPLLRAPALSYSRRGPDVLLGNDFLRSHRVLVARAEDRIYFSYAGGAVFPALPAAECRER